MCGLAISTPFTTMGGCMKSSIRMCLDHLKQEYVDNLQLMS